MAGDKKTLIPPAPLPVVLPVLGVVVVEEEKVG